MICVCRLCNNELSYDSKCEKCNIKYSSIDSGTFLMIKPEIAVYFLNFTEGFVELSTFDGSMKSLSNGTKIKKLHKFSTNNSMDDIKSFCVKYIKNSTFI